MRLLQTKTLQMAEFFDSQAIPTFSSRRNLPAPGSREQLIPEYAILSHVWDLEEVSFQDMMGERAQAEKKIGFSKIKKSCAQAVADGFSYIWIDTCCIDKTSSTELSEAINSMYQWYRNSAVCYVFLIDVDQFDRNISDCFSDREKVVDADLFDRHFNDYLVAQDNTIDDFKAAYEKARILTGYSRWFTRGWTLQELLAPTQLEFFNSSWEHMGTKREHRKMIAEISGIDLYALDGGDLRRLTIARRMSWIGNRQTTRSEDMAYCLLGIFGINMPLLYGEGSNAFIRLQEEIMKFSDDKSIFAWKDDTSKRYRDDYVEISALQGLLAPAPNLFKSIESNDTLAQFYSETPGWPVSMSTNKGLQITFLMCKDLGFSSGLIYVAVLNCSIGRFPGILAAIRLKRLSPTGDQYARIDLSQLHHIAAVDSHGCYLYEGFDPTQQQNQLSDVKTNIVYSNWTVKTIFVRQEPQIPSIPSFWLVLGSAFQILKDDNEWKVLAAYPSQLWDSKTQIMQSRLDNNHGTRKLGAFLLAYRKMICVLVFGVTYWELTPWCKPYSAPWESDGPLSRDVVVKQAFDNFLVDQVKLPTNLETRRHSYISKDLGLRTVVEPKVVSGRETYIIRVLPFAATDQPI